MNIKELFSSNTEQRKQRYLKKIEEEAKDIYQLREFAGELWLTYNGFLICPTEMFDGGEELQALENIRDLYVARNTKEE